MRRKKNKTPQIADLWEPKHQIGGDQRVRVQIILPHVYGVVYEHALLNAARSEIEMLYIKRWEMIKNYRHILE